jgi:orotidine-5'-phosphate decarboxylase
MTSILAKLDARSKAVNSLVCVGLDPEIEKIPKPFRSARLPLFEFNRWVIEQTHEFVAAYKPNMAFFEARGQVGLRELESTIQYLRVEHPQIMTICDAKRGDIGSTNHGYVTSIFDVMQFDAATLHPYLGHEALKPFLERKEKACIVLCRTSNPGAGEFQDLEFGGRPLWELVAERVSQQWNTNENCMLVVGATYPSEMQQIRKIAPTMPFLVPGVGAQGGDAAAVVRAGLDANGGGLLISSSRGVMYAPSPADAARELRDEINAAREAIHASR